MFLKKKRWSLYFSGNISIGDNVIVEHYVVTIGKHSLGQCVGNSPFTGGFLSQKAVMQIFDIFLIDYPNKFLNKQ